MTRPSARLLATAAFCPCASVLALALPEGSGALNVRDFGAKGDGIADDTQAIRKAVGAASADQGKVFWPARMVYFPAGTYRVTDTISKKDAQGRYLSSMSLMGESKDRVRIRLDDAAPGYGRADQPKAVIYTSSSLLAGEPDAGGKDYLGKGEGNDAYGNYVEDITLDVGRRNPGAIGIDYVANNVGAIRDVRLVAGPGSGHTALSMERKWPGPLLVSAVAIEGWARGIAVRHPEYGVTLQNLRLSGQSEVAIRNHGNSLAMRNIGIETAAVAIENVSADGLVVADRVAVRLTGPAASWAHNRGHLTFQGVTVSAAGAAKSLPAQTVPFGRPGAYFGSQRLAAFEAGWRLPAPGAPAAWAAPASRWASVASFGARADSGEDASPAIRRAMESGAEVVYFPSGRYVVSEAIEIPAHVRRLAGFFSSITIERRTPAFAREAGMLRVATGGEPLTIEKLALDNAERGPQVGIEHQGPRTLVVRDFIGYGVTGLQRKASGGAVFLENVSVGPIRIEGPEGVWASQFNTEGTGTRIVNAGAPLSILGLKSEQNCTLVENLPGAQTEVLGGLLYLVQVPQPPRPAFVNHPGARLSAAYAESAYIDGAVYREHASSLRPDGSREVIEARALPSRGRARIAPGIGMPAAAKP